MYQRRWISQVLPHIFLGILSLGMLFPVAYVFLTSFKTRTAVLTSPPTILPSVWALDGYIQLWRSPMLAYYLPNTFINALGASLITVPLATLTGYLLSRLPSRYRRLVEAALLTLLLLPGITTFIPLHRLASSLGLLNTNALMIAIQIGGSLPLSIWLIKRFCESIPPELEEAAMLDGATSSQSLGFVVLPLILPGIFAAFLLTFVDAWNEFLAAVIFLSRYPAKTASVGLLDFQSQFEVAYHVQAAACVIMALPVVGIFLLLHRFFFQALFEGLEEKDKGK